MMVAHHSEKKLHIITVELNLLSSDGAPLKSDVVVDYWIDDYGFIDFHDQPCCCL
jgi:hypothetical protein